MIAVDSMVYKCLVYESHRKRTKIISYIVLGYFWIESAQVVASEKTLY